MNNWIKIENKEPFIKKVKNKKINKELLILKIIFFSSCAYTLYYMVLIILLWVN